MKTKIIICAIISICFVPAIIFVTLHNDFNDYQDSIKSPDHFSDNVTTHKPPEKTSVHTAPALSENPGIEKYILSYNPDLQAVLLVTKYKDGSELISRIDSIRPEFLEDNDVQALITGIELYNREDMLILIEDYSS